VKIKGWERRLNSYEKSYCLYLSFGKANWNTTLNESLTQEYADKYAASDHKLGCYTQAVVSENIYTVGRRDTLKFLLDLRRFKEEDERLYFDAKISKASCKN